MIEKITTSIWTIRFDLESARERYAEAGHLWRQAAACVALALIRLAGARK